MEFKIGDKVLINPKIKKKTFRFEWNPDMESLYTNPGEVIRKFTTDGSVAVRSLQGNCWFCMPKELIPYRITLNKNKLGNFPRKKV